MKKYVKYKDRISKILNGEFSKIPNTLANKLKIAQEFGNFTDLSTIILKIDLFPERNDIVNIFVKLISLETDPNPISVWLSTECEVIIEHLLEAFQDPTFCTSHTDLIIALL